MPMGVFQFHRVRPSRRDPNAEVNVGPLAVPDTEPWWIVLNRILDDAEWETVESARVKSKDPNACMAAVNAGEGVALVRQKLKEAREIALSRRR